MRAKLATVHGSAQVQCLQADSLRRAGGATARARVVVCAQVLLDHARANFEEREQKQAAANQRLKNEIRAVQLRADNLAKVGRG